MSGKAKAAPIAAASAPRNPPVRRKTARETRHDDHPFRIAAAADQQPLGARALDRPIPSNGWRRAGAISPIQPAMSIVYGLLIFADLGRLRRRPDRARPRLHPVSGLRRLHGGRTDPRRRALREEPPHRGRPAAALGQPVLRQAALGRPDPVHGRAALPADDGLDARRRASSMRCSSASCRSPASITSRRCCSPPRSAGRCSRSAPPSAGCSRRSPLRSAPSRFRCCSTSRSMP